MEGNVALEGDGKNLPTGKAKHLGFIFIDNGELAVDAVCVKVMGIDPVKIKHLMLAYQKGLGVMDLEENEVRGQEIEDVTTPFELLSTFK